MWQTRLFEIEYKRILLWNCSNHEQSDCSTRTNSTFLACLLLRYGVCIRLFFFRAFFYFLRSFDSKMFGSAWSNMFFGSNVQIAKGQSGPKIILVDCCIKKQKKKKNHIARGIDAITQNWSHIHLKYNNSY